MNLQATIFEVLQSDPRHALTFDEIVRGVSERLEGDIRANLNKFTDEQRIHRHQGGRDYPWRYQAVQINRRV